MLPNKVTSVSFESFRDLAQGKKVVLLYPWANFRNVFLSYFLNDIGEGLLYHRIPNKPDSLRDWLGGLLDEIQLGLGDFGRQLEDALDGASASEMGVALAADFGQINIERAVLFLDELDRVPQDAEFRSFMTALVDNLPANVQLAVNSRLLTYEPWINWVNSDQAVVLGTAHRSNNLMFTKEATPKPQLEVYAFGRGHAISNGREIRSWDGALPRNLFFYFVDNPVVTRDQIFDIFWPKLSIKDATNVFHVTKRKITERISMHVDDEHNYELTNYSSGFYVPSDKVVRHYDVADFEHAMEGALMSNNLHEQEVLFRHAVDIYKAPFLHTIKLAWVDARRKQLQTMYAEALIGLANLQAGRGEWERALGSYARVLRESPQREDIHRKVIEMYINLGRVEDARQQYSLLERMLKRKLGVAPSDETRALLQSLDQ